MDKGGRYKESGIISERYFTLVLTPTHTFNLAYISRPTPREGIKYDRPDTNSSVVSTEEGLFNTRPDGERDDKQLIWMTQMIEGGTQQL